MEIYIPNSEDTTVWIQLDTKSYKVRFHQFRDLVYADISDLEENVVSGLRVLPNQWLIPEYLVDGGGNIRFETYKPDAKEYVHPSGYNTKFKLNAYTKEEIEELLEDEG